MATRERSTRDDETAARAIPSPGRVPGTRRRREARPLPAPEDDPLWYKDAIIYQVHVRAFFDSNNDGIGDFAGLTEKLDYIKDLGVTAIWLLPFYPSPLRDDGYDIADYRDVHPSYGTIQDFRRFMREAKRRGLRVVTELVLNHTSDQHHWFQRARRAKPGSRWRNFYVWSDTPDRYAEARIIFKDFESSNWSWEPVARQYYWHRFYTHQPDLNFDNPEVHRAMFRVLDFWLNQGVDGLRLDAVPYLYEREGTNCENLPETHAYLKALRRHVDERFRNRMLLAEANQWPEDAVAYFGDGDECHMAFHFPVMPRLFMAIRMEDRFPIADIMEQTPAIPETCQWAIFLRNHDELTLEMVTDEERDYMYRSYAYELEMRINLGIRRRLAPLLGNSRRKIELMNGLLFSLPGTPVLYYGDEIGMGDNIFLGDRDGVRTPMQWSGDRNAGFSRANPQRLFLPVVIDPGHHYEALNVEAQQDNPSSLLWWMKRLIALRKQYRAFGRGSLEFVSAENRKVLAFLRRYDDEIILVVANLSRFAQAVELDLSEWSGRVPVELFGRTEFPRIGGGPYFLTLGPHAFFWFALEPERPGAEAAVVVPARRLAIDVIGSWDRVLEGEALARFEARLTPYLSQRRWFAGKARRMRTVSVTDVLPIRMAHDVARIALVEVTYLDADSETYVLPLAYAAGDRAASVCERSPDAALTWLRIQPDGEEGVVFDAAVEPDFAQALLHAMIRRRRQKGRTAEVAAAKTRAFRDVCGEVVEPLEVTAVRGEQSNTALIYGDRLFLKLFRRLEPGVNPDLEVGRFLTDHGFPHSPPVAGAMEIRRGGDRMTLAILKAYVPNEGDAWDFTVDDLGRYFEEALARPAEERPELPHRPLATATLLEGVGREPAREAVELIGAYLESAALLGRRTAELHAVLASAPENPDFAPEPFSALYQRSLYQSMRMLVNRNLPLLERRRGELAEGVRADAEALLDQRDELHRRFQAIVGEKIPALRIRCHGDYHLGQVLYTGRDFVIIDFEGEPARPVSERRLKRSPLSDVAGMLRSFHYAAYTALLDRDRSVVLRPGDVPPLDFWARFWTHTVCVAFLRAYLEDASGTGLLPRRTDELATLLDVYVLEKAVYELGYELNNRPDWLPIPLRGLLQLLQS